MPGLDRDGFGEQVDREFHRSVAEATPLGRWGRPQDVAEAAVYLASPEAAFLTGQAINVNGGGRDVVHQRTPEGGLPWSGQAQAENYELDEVEGKLKELGLDAWYLEDGWIRRKYNTDGWPSTLMAVNAIGYLCEQAWHHADLSVTWGKLWVKLRTHASGGITDNDFSWRAGSRTPCSGARRRTARSRAPRTSSCSARE